MATETKQLPLFFFASQVSGDQIKIPKFFTAFDLHKGNSLAAKVWPKFFTGLPNPRTVVSSETYDFNNLEHERVFLWKICQPFDGILISLGYISQKMQEKIRENGVKKFFQVPDKIFVMGDCGAWQYKHLDEVPYTPEAVIEYYEQGRFDYGITLDQLVIKSNLTWKEKGETKTRIFNRQDQEKRMEFTLKNAKIMNEISSPQKIELFGSLQGVTPEDYAFMTQKYLKMGFSNLAVGGVAKTHTSKLKQILDSIIQTIIDYGLTTQEIKIHVLGVGRPTMFDYYKDNGIWGFDTARFHRVAWIKGTYLYWNGWNLEEYDVRKYDYRKYNEDPPIPICSCPICQVVGKDNDEIIWTRRFGTNQRNMSRGFHNIWHFWHFYQSVMRGTLVITSCTKKKRKRRTQARNLYQGRLFKLIKKLCEQKEWDLLILSAKYGVVEPNDVIEPYEKTINSIEDITGLQNKILPKLKKKTRKYGNIILIAGKKYRQIVEPLMDDRWSFLASKGYGDLCKKVKQKIDNQGSLVPYLGDKHKLLEASQK